MSVYLLTVVTELTKAAPAVPLETLPLVASGMS